MAQNGMFRSSMRGFHKQDVLQYIDGITAEWNEERVALEQAATEAAAARDALQASTDEAVATAAAAVEQQQAAENQLEDALQRLADTSADLTTATAAIEEMAIQLEEAQRRLAQLEQELAATAGERNSAVAALTDAKEQLTVHTATARELEESRRQVSRQNEEIAAMRQTIRRYESVVGDADTVHEKVSGIVRPYIEQTGREADETLNDVQASLDALLAQVGELQSSIDRSRHALQSSRADSDSRLAAALDEWLSAAQDAGGERHFFP